MKNLTIVSVAVFLAWPAASHAQFPATPEKEHEWLKQLVGEWDSEGEAGFQGQTITSKGTEKSRMVGDLWFVAEHKGEVMGMQMNAIMTLGYDPNKKKFVGTWIDSMQNHLWKYEGTLDETGKVLTLEAEGPSFSEPGKMSNYRDVIEIKSKDHKIMTSWLQGEDGEWTKFMTANYRRKK